MIKIENSVLLYAMNLWDKSDSEIKYENVRDSEGYLEIGSNDHALMMKLRNAGTDHRKFMRMITVYLDITAPLYWWEEFKTYRAGRKFGDDEPNIIDEGYLEYDIEMNSCSTMHKIAEKEFTLEDFSCEHLTPQCIECLRNTISLLNMHRSLYISKTDKQVNQYTVMSDEFYAKYKKDIWWQLIQLLPNSYNQRRTVMLNYEVLANIYKSRCNHKLDEWRALCNWIESLPYSELITGEFETEVNI